MKKFIALLVLLYLSGPLLAREKDTTFINRPYYFGLTVGYSAFASYATRGVPFEMDNLPRAHQDYEEFHNDRSIGVELSFPFLRRWECEADFERVVTRGWKQQCSYWVNPHTQPEEVNWSASSRNTLVNNLKIRSFFSYEILANRNFVLNAGAGGWYSSIARIGAEAGVKCYWSANKNLAFQAGFYGGYTEATKLYATVRCSVLLKGKRTYRVHPNHYYVRTYEEGE
jgi:hypothetical protein